MSPIYIRPAREQAEHDRLIRFLQSKYAKKFEVVVNVGDEQTAPVKLGAKTFFPDLVLLTGADRKISGLIEIETGESTNNLEALAQWQHFGRAKVPFHLYVPVLMVDAARRFCTAHKVSVTEIWTYRPLFEGFDLVREFHDPSAVANAPKGISVTAKLLPPVVPVKIEKESERDIKAEMLAAVELAARALRASSRMSASARASATKAAAARAAAGKATASAVPVGPAAAVPMAKVPVPPAKAAAKPVAPVKAVAPAKPVVAPKTQPKAAVEVVPPVKAKLNVPPAKPSKAVKPVKPAKAKAPIKPAKAKAKPAPAKSKPAKAAADKSAKRFVKAAPKVQKAAKRKPAPKAKPGRSRKR